MTEYKSKHKEPNLKEELAKANEKDKEPVMRPATVVAIVGSILGALTAFGLDIDEKAKLGILTFGMFFIPFIVGLWARKNAWSPASIVKLANQIVSKK